MTGKPIDVSGKDGERRAWGGIACGPGCWRVCDLHEALDRTYGVERTVEPDPAAHAMYTEWFEQVYLSCILRCVSRFLRLITCSRRNNASESITSAIRLCLENVEICLGFSFCGWIAGGRPSRLLEGR